MKLFGLFRKPLAGLVLSVFVLCLLPGPATLSSQAEAKAKKKTSAKKIKRTKKHTARSRSIAPRPKGILTQRYYLEEGADTAEGEKLGNELKAIGVDETSFDVENNILKVTFKTNKLSSVAIISKLKSLGYTVKRID